MVACTGLLVGETVPPSLKERGETWSLRVWSLVSRLRGRSSCRNRSKAGTAWSPVDGSGVGFRRGRSTCGFIRRVVDRVVAHAANHFAGVPPPTPP